MKKTTLAITLAAATVIGLGGWAAQQQRGGQEPGGGQPDMGAALIEGLLATPGCLGVDAGQFRSGKNAILAWFENKQAAVAWYNSPTHRRFMGGMGVDPTTHEHTPLAHVPDDVPLLVIASITFTDKPEIEGIPMPISQIAIEIYSPQPGGAHINGRLAPDSFKVRHMKDYAHAADG